MSDGFLSRWARRKEDVQRRERTEILPQDVSRQDASRQDVPAQNVVPPGAGDAAEAGLVPADGRGGVPDPAAAETDSALLADLPSLDDLTADTDLAPFLRAGVPAILRNAALRRMWSVDPAIRDFVSEAREYAYDWNTPGGVPGLGPLLPGDDVKAMLGRLFNRDPSEAPDPGPHRADPADPGEPAPTAGSLTPPDPEAARESAAETAVVAALPAANPPDPPDLASATRRNAVAAPRLRRHGGAMPS